MQHAAGLLCREPRNNALLISFAHIRRPQAPFAHSVSQAALARHAGQLRGLRWNGQRPEFVRREGNAWVVEAVPLGDWPKGLHPDWPAGSTLSIESLSTVASASVLSGSPVLEGSNRVIRGLRVALGQDFPIIGVGGILSGHDAIAKIEAGADVVQIYTGLIYKGPALVTEVASALQQMKR